MEIPKYSELDFSDEVKTLCSINERFDNEPDIIKNIRLDYAMIMENLTNNRDVIIWAWPNEWKRNFSIAITHLEDSLMRAIKAVYCKN